MKTYEIFFLLSASYVHDIGMCKLKELGDGDTLSDVEKDTIRRTHHKRIRELLERHPELFGLDDQEAIYIGRIAQGHRRVNLFDNREFRHNDSFKGQRINVPMLAAFLRLADELDITFERIPPFLYKHSLPKEIVSLEEWQKHWQTTGVTLDKEKVIEATSICHSPSIHRKLRNTERIIKLQLNELRKHLHQYSRFKDLLHHGFELTIQKIGYEDPEVRLVFDPNTIMNLLMGERLYQHKEYAIRELLKNAVDACSKKRALSLKKNFQYQPSIWVNLNSNRLSVTDNGAGHGSRIY
jgi:hypothetical protein